MPYSGITAKLVVNNEDVAYISNWSIEETHDTIEVTQLGKDTKEIVPSLYYWTASAEGAADFSDNAQKTLRDAMRAGTEVDITFYLSDTARLVGKAYVTAFSVNISAEDKGGVSISVTGNGELKLNPEPEKESPKDQNTDEMTQNQERI